MAAGDTPDLLSNARQGPFAQSPQALRSIFQITGEKAYPQFQAGFVQPTIDVEMLTLGPQFQSLQGGSCLATAPGLFLSGGLVVPNGFAWLIQAAEADCNTLVGENIRFRMIMLTGTLGQAVGLGGEATSSLTDAAAVSKTYAFGTFDVPIWAPPGSTFGIAVGRITTAGTISVPMALRFVPIKL